MVLASALVLGGSTLISGCTTSDNELVVENDKTPSVQKAGTFTFQLNGTKARSSFAPVSRDAVDNHAFESEIKTVYVAFFTKKENTEESTLRKLYTDENGEDGTGATITKADDGSSYTITDDQLFTGDYIAYFITNPGAKLKASLENLTPGDSKLSDFKAISIEEDTPNGGDTPGNSTNGTGLVMISDEMNITITEDKTISNITMTRLAARFDIINTQPTTGEGQNKHGATITNVTITNEAVKSDLIVPAANTNANYLSTKEATQWTTDATEMTFYTYENFPNGVSDNTSLTVTYTLDGSSTSKTLTIYLTDKNTGTQLGVKRNHLYSIYLNCVTGQYTLSVKDWETGETVNLPDKNIYVEYTADDLGKIGDYAYNDNGTLAFIDGGLRKMYLNGDLDWEPNFTTTLPEDKDYLGIVFSNLTSATDYNAGYTKGYIMAAANVKGNGTVAWGPSTDSPITNIGNTINGAMHLDGRTNCDAIKNANPSILDSYPPIKAAVEYQVTLPANTNVSGWFLPSMGQLLTMFSNLCEDGKIRNLSGSIDGSSGFRYSFKNNNYANKFNERFSRIPNSSDYSLSTVYSVHFTSSDEYNKSSYGYFFLNPQDNYMLIKCGGTKNNIGGAQVRPVFAF